MGAMAAGRLTHGSASGDLSSLHLRNMACMIYQWAAHLDAECEMEPHCLTPRVGRPRYREREPGGAA